jgi:hypothetical protein
MSTTISFDPADRPVQWTGTAGGAVAAAATAAAAAAGVLVGLLGMPALAAIGAIGLMVLIAHRPEVGAYLFLATTPLLVGIDRGVMMPLLRPNEALLLVVVGGLTMRGLVFVGRGAPLRVHLTRIEWAIVALAVFGSVTPLLWMYARGVGITLDDLLYATTMWKYLAVYGVVRVAIRTEVQVRTALGLAMAAGVVVAAVAVLQSLQLFGVPQILASYYAPLDDVEVLSIGRGTSTLSSSLAVGDVMAFLLAATIAWWHREPRLRPILLVAGLAYVVGALGSGQFSAVLALLVAAIVAAVLTRSLGRLLAVGLPVIVVAALLLQPVIQTRLEGFESDSGVPQSWTVRVENLETYFWPEVARDWNWTLGVRTSSRVPAPEVWRDYVFIESGHTWLLWNGGLPFLLAFVVYLVIGLRAVTPIARRRPDAIGVAATASAAALWVLAVLMLFDPHLTMRGTADLSFPLLALALTAWRRGPAPPTHPIDPTGEGDDTPSPAERRPKWAQASV